MNTRDLLNSLIWISMLTGCTLIGYGTNWMIGLGLGFILWAITKVIVEAG
jgi:hypothetical protein